MKNLIAIALVISGPAFAQDAADREPPLESLVLTLMLTPEAAAEDAVRRQMIGCTRSLKYVPDVFSTASCADAKKTWDIIVQQNEARGQK